MLCCVVTSLVWTWNVFSGHSVQATRMMSSIFQGRSNIRAGREHTHQFVAFLHVLEQLAFIQCLEPTTLVAA
jgi:hypothetical protein